VLPRLAGGAACVAAALALCACSGDSAQTAGPAQSSQPDLCASLDTLSDQVAQLQIGPPSDAPSDTPSDAPSDGVSEQVRDVEAALDRVAAASDGSLESAIAGIRTSLTDFTDELASGTEAGRAAAEQSLDEVRQGWTSLTQAVDVQCAGASPS
jgi:hypothetical protein